MGVPLILCNKSKSREWKWINVKEICDNYYIIIDIKYKIAAIKNDNKEKKLLKQRKLATVNNDVG